MGHQTQNFQSSPGHAQSNGKVKSAKRIMQKTKKSNSDPFIALLNFRNTP
jgi:hypothetical protein